MRLEHAMLSTAFRYFQATAQAGSIRAAARGMNVASSAVNRQILMLEDALGLKLFERTGRKLVITEPGTVLLQTVESSLAGYEQALRVIEAMKGLETGQVHVASVESVAVSLLPRILKAFRVLYPGIRVRVMVTDADTVTEAVATRRADLGITFNPRNLEGLDVALRRRVTVGAVVGRKHPLSVRQWVSLEECLAYPLAYPATGLSLRAVLDAVDRPDIGTADMALEANSLRLMASLARLDDAFVTFQTPIGIETDLAAGDLVFLPLTDESLPPEDMALVRQRSRAPSPAAEAFFRQAADVLDEATLY